MPDIPEPPPPEEQVALRRWLEAFLRLRGAEFSHHDTFWLSDDGLMAINGWGTRIERGPAQTPVEVWFDQLDDDVAVWSGDRRRDYVEWVDLSDMAHLLDDMEGMLLRMLGTYPVSGNSG